MPKFGIESYKQLATCHPDLQLLFNTIIPFIDCKIMEGYRNEEDQELAFKNHKTTLHFPHGKHNKSPSLAADVAPFPIDWANEKRFFWFAGLVLGVARMLKAQGKMRYDVRYGGDWNQNYDIVDEKGLKDLVHFELVMF